MGDTMRIAFTRHAERRIAQRESDREQVIEVARSPEQVVWREGKPLVGQSRVTIEGKPALLRVAFHDEGNTRLVITVYYTVSIERYWQEEG